VGATQRAQASARAALPEATPEDKSWKELKGRAARWFARLEADGQSHAPHPVAAVARARA
jgi:hypothetical protein